MATGTSKRIKRGQRPEESFFRDVMNHVMWSNHGCILTKCESTDLRRLSLAFSCTLLRFLGVTMTVPLQQLGIMKPEVRDRAKAVGLAMVKVIRLLLLNPRSPVVCDVQVKESRDNTDSCCIYAAYERKAYERRDMDVALRKVSLASSLKCRKALGYDDKPEILIRMIFRIDGMPTSMDSAVYKLYLEFWESIRKIDPYYAGLYKLVMEDGAGGLGINKKIVSRNSSKQASRPSVVSGRRSNA